MYVLVFFLWKRLTPSLYCLSPPSRCNREIEQLRDLDISKEAEKKEPISSNSWILLTLMIKVWVKDGMKNVAIAACSKTCFSVALLSPVLSAHVEWIVGALCDFVVKWSSLLSMNFLMTLLSEMTCKRFHGLCISPINFPLENIMGSGRADKDRAEWGKPAPKPLKFCSQK